jgi:hypothetical protein
MAALSRAHKLPAEFHVGVLFENSAPDTAQRSEIMRQARRLLPVMRHGARGSCNTQENAENAWAPMLGVRFNPLHRSSAIWPDNR